MFISRVLMEYNMYAICVTHTIERTLTYLFFYTYMYVDKYIIAACQLTISNNNTFNLLYSYFHVFTCSTFNSDVAGMWYLVLTIYGKFGIFH